MHLKKLDSGQSKKNIFFRLFQHLSEILGYLPAWRYIRALHNSPLSALVLQNCCKKHQRPFQTNFNEPYKNSFAFSQIEATASLGNLSDIPFLLNRRDLPTRPQLLCSQSNYDSQSSRTKGFWEKKTLPRNCCQGASKRKIFSNVHVFWHFFLFFGSKASQSISYIFSLSS